MWPWKKKPRSEPRTTPAGVREAELDGTQAIADALQIHDEPKFKSYLSTSSTIVYSGAYLSGGTSGAYAKNYISTSAGLQPWSPPSGQKGNKP